MQAILTLVRWSTVVALLFAAVWTAFLGYLVQGWITQWPKVVETLPQEASLATNAVAGNFWFLWLFAVLTSACAAFLAWKRDVPVGFAAIAASALLLSAMAFNVLVVSAGFEISAMAEQ